MEKLIGIILIAPVVVRMLMSFRKGWKYGSATNALILVTMAVAGVALFLSD